MKTIAVVLFMLLGGCAADDPTEMSSQAATQSVTCSACGQNLQCNGPIQQCISPGPCVTNADGNLVLNADGSYTQTGSAGGTFSVNSLGVALMPSAAPGVTALVSVSVNSCPF